MPERFGTPSDIVLLIKMGDFPKKFLYIPIYFLVEVRKMADLPIAAVVRIAKKNGAERVGSDAAEALVVKAEKYIPSSRRKQTSSQSTREERRSRKKTLISHQSPTDQLFFSKTFPYIREGSFPVYPLSRATAFFNCQVSSRALFRSATRYSRHRALCTTR